MDMNNRGNQAVAILMVVVLVGFAWDLGRKQTLNLLLGSPASSTNNAELIEGAYTSNKGPTASNAKDSEKTLPLLAGDESIQVADQSAGMEVKVSSLSLSEMGWVGVRDNEGRVLGAGRFDAGSFKDVTISLLRATVAGDSYQALLYVDDGDKAFDLQKDILITGSNGGVAGTNFKAL